MYEKQHIANTFWGVCQSPRRRQRGQVRIVLNADAIFRKKLPDTVVSPLECIFNVLLHEVSQPTDSILPYKTCSLEGLLQMCHACKIVRCLIGEACQGETMHDEHFGTKINVVDRRTRRDTGVFGRWRTPPATSFLSNWKQLEL